MRNLRNQPRTSLQSLTIDGGEHDVKGTASQPFCKVIENVLQKQLSPSIFDFIMDATIQQVSISRQALDIYLFGEPDALDVGPLLLSGVKSENTHLEPPGNDIWFVDVDDVAL